MAVTEFEGLGELEDDLLEAADETGFAAASPAAMTSPLAIRSPRGWRTSGGKRKKPVWGIVVHTTGSGPAAMAGKPNRWNCKSTIDCALALYGTGGMEGFPHYVIGYDGTIYAVAPENYVAWHAGWTKETGGRAAWARWSAPRWWSSVRGSGRTPLDLIPKDAGSPNTRHIGIELLGGPSGWGFTEAQYRSLARLVTDIEKRHGLNLGEPPNPRLLGHEDVNPLTTKGGRADAHGGWDPGAHREPSRFSWKRLGGLMREARAAAGGIGSTANREFELEDELEPEDESELELESAVPRRPLAALAPHGRRPPVAGARPVVGKWLIPFVSRAIPHYRDAKGKLQSTACAVCVSDTAWRQTAIDLIVFFHGDQIDAPGNPCKHDFDPEKVIRNFRLDAQVNSVGRKVAVAVPVIHWTRGDSGFARTAAGASDRFPGKWSADNLNRFIEEVRDEIGQQSGVKPTIVRLIIAGHSHAYAVLSPLAAAFSRGAAATTAGALSKLSEVWALDSTYGSGSVSALDGWARALPRGRIIAVLNRDRSAGCSPNGYFKPVECWSDYYRSRRPPPNLKMCKVGETHCVIPTRYIGQLLSATGYPPGWCQV